MYKTSLVSPEQPVVLVCTKGFLHPLVCMQCSQTYMVFAQHVFSALMYWSWCLVVQLSEPIWFTNQKLKKAQAGYIAYCSLQICKEVAQI